MQTKLVRNPRLEKLLQLDEKIRVTLLGDENPSWDLLKLQKRVKEEIRQLAKDNCGYERVA